jgi:hypothetical protein
MTMAAMPTLFLAALRATLADEVNFIPYIKFLGVE